MYKEKKAMGDTSQRAWRGLDRLEGDKTGNEKNTEIFY